MSIISGYCDPNFLEIEDIFSKSIESNHETGASVAIEYQGKLIVDLFGGHTDAAKKNPWNENTLVNVFSVTKGVTAACVAMLIDQGKLDVNSKVSQYWPEYACNGKENTKVMDFLCHRSNNFAFRNGIPVDSWQNWDTFTKALAEQKPFGEPGSSQGYHALTFGWLVGEIVKRVDGRDVGTFFKEEIADPFNINFKIGLSDEDLVNCADMLMFDNDNTKSSFFSSIKYVPDFLLPRQIKNLKKSLIDEHFKLAFQKRRGDDKNNVNSIDWRKAQIPSANGHGTSAGLAKLYGILSTGCERNGYKLMSPETLRHSYQPHSSGPDSVLFGSDISFGIGFEIAGEEVPKGNFAPRFMGSMFGHAGIGGAVAFGDAKKEIGFSFLCNEMHPPKDLYKTVNLLIDSLYSKI
ncbi:beta-lactamase family protein [Gammaproteobacteria bacterium]|nr:beta-lactamase family protein [Gammaproteobacteria bacterium]MDA9342859.1 beta-lactamase family protein [Gammaproteobacteria bacterium]MDA9356531.1 beta-lactamase family protein [Gammaproteobacteria bacterium]MDB9747139.1 beta-lactamase family protein [Gammaproteobacteria bacterium]MDB9763835.1 beta-lactamase family protein [Gammaproteobacteria bacterium]